MRRIRRKSRVDSRVMVPGSKSLTHRALIAGALSGGPLEIVNGLKSQDTSYTMGALRALGVRVEERGGLLIVDGSGLGQGFSHENLIFLGESGTSLRFIMGLAALLPSWTRLYGGKRLTERPVGPLARALISLGADIRWYGREGYLPLGIRGGDLRGGDLSIALGESSQYISSLMLIGPYIRGGLRLRPVGPQRSWPYVTMTAGVMAHFGVSVTIADNLIEVRPGSCYKAVPYVVEPDCSNASYFLALPLLVGGRLMVHGLSKRSLQGDIGFLGILEDMGALCWEEQEGIWVEGQGLRGTGVDMGPVPDLVPTVAALAAFAEGKTLIRNVPHLRLKESDRIHAICTEWRKLGIGVMERPDGLVIQGGGDYTPAVLSSHQDHRMAMAIALLGSRLEGVGLMGDRAVDKSFPGFWELWDAI